MSDRKSNLIAGALSSLMGAGVAAAIYLRPEGLKVPAWVACAAAFAFVLVGFVIFAIETGRVRLHRWLIVALLAAMFTPAAWVAFGPGEREYAVAAGLLNFMAFGLVCRSAFGLGALLLAVMLFVAYRAARAGKHAE